jgi:MFS family permease
VGALISAVTLAMRRTILGLGRVIAASAFIFGASLIAFGGSHWLWLSLPLMLATGYSMMQIFSACNTILQTIVDEDKRGRVMAFYTMSFIGVAPFGSLIAGALARKIGAPLTVALGGTLCIVVAARFAVKRKELAEVVRPIYIGLGILPEIATGIEAAATLQTPPE